jgi:zinc/manganese transport system substrate-binding protein
VRQPPRRLSLAAIAVAALVALTGCVTGPRDPASDGHVHIVASINVYGDLARSVAGEDADITSVIDDAAQDPHEFEASARVQLALSRADIVIVNGGGYDDFMQTMLDAAGNDDAIVIDAVSISGLDAGAEAFNEHVWYDYDAMSRLVTQLASDLQEVDPDGAAQYAVSRSDVAAELDLLATTAADARGTVGGAGAIVTEPVPLYLLEAMGFENLTPPAFSEAVEEDSDVAPALLKNVLNIVANGSAALVAYNAQTGGPQTDAVLDAAAENQVPAIAVTEILPEGTHYVAWQRAIQQEFLSAVDDAG